MPVSKALCACMPWVVTALLSGCGHRSPSAPQSGAPVACFTMTSQLEDGATCLYQLNFILDASCSTDDLTPADSLEVRWDYENDGTWDTDFSRARVVTSFSPDPAHTPWRARCQVRDRDENISQVTRSLALGPFPTSPDLIAGDIYFRDPSNAVVDTVRVLAEFSVIVTETCHGDFSTPLWEARILRNGALVDSMEFGCSGGLFGCSGGGRGGFTIAVPGTYEFTALLDSDGAYAETNESNNTARGTLVVVP